MAKKDKPPAGPDDLVRAAAGAYRSGDGRFEVQKADQGWFIVDSEQANEFGQQLIHGPFATLGDVTVAIPGSRDIKPLLRSARRTTAKKSTRAAKQTAPNKPAPPPSWIDRLPRDEATQVRRLIRALERDGVKDTEALVRKDRGGLSAVVAKALLDRALAEVIDALPEKERGAAGRVVKRIGEVLEAGTKVPPPLPGWALYELGTGREPTRRRLRIDG